MLGVTLPCRTATPSWTEPPRSHGSFVWQAGNPNRFSKRVAEIQAAPGKKTPGGAGTHTPVEGSGPPKQGREEFLTELTERRFAAFTIKK